MLEVGCAGAIHIDDILVKVRKCSCTSSMEQRRMTSLCAELGSVRYALDRECVHRLGAEVKVGRRHRTTTVT